MDEPSLKEHGDDFERATWSEIQAFFPYYQTFWRQHIYPLRSAGSIHLRDGLDQNFEYLAMYHYSVYVNLARAHQKIKEQSEDFRFVEEIYANMERAAELAIKTVDKFGAIYDDCIQDKLKVNTIQLNTLRAERLEPYRNLLHEALPASVKDAGDNWLIPLPNRLPEYDRWSKVKYHSQREHLVAVETQLWNDFKALCSHLQEIWKSMCAASQRLNGNPTYLLKRQMGDSVVSREPLLTPAVSTTFAAVSSNFVEAVIAESRGKADW